ncbi:MULTISPECIES: O-antigen ligase family protein [Pasteurellaceae]|uniref:O-antigen ligase family protein n=1 Tax=Pasteurella atlantica TaxID=2827233 RepID=A0AAW8CK80_9PAST|nr:O-antigen ligase family protein [Pasteurella atlantica]MBR0574500.1 O-antigen ligase family protein [Pasteurella atlantica]MDP8040361.1 O-antigen ligase family protein [Pasteurella atlantica]MDP8042412.1 O-antigen ligase family protein [Pasteurella atlantica]MDP8044631.1 O-antigen ligase family protein [Pasteurella atlantica]MDP8046686.1 O-antigen ligase family protein [Pasteurella atlantica]
MLSILNRINIYTLLTGAFFILTLHFRASYTIIPAILFFSGLYFIIVNLKNKTFKINPENKLFIVSFIGYFALFILSLIIHQGKLRELDLPSRILLILPFLTLFSHIKIKPLWIIYAIVTASFVAGIVAIIQKYYLHISFLFPQHNKIQASDIAISLALFSLCICLYFYQIRNKLFAIFAGIAFLLGFIASILCFSRGAIIGFLIAIPVILWFYRHLFSKKAFFIVFLAAILFGYISYNTTETKWNIVYTEASLCINKNKCRSSVGTRLDMYKSALHGIDQKPLLGWGLEGVKKMRKQHAEQGYISRLAAKYHHAHNQFLHDGSARGIFGLLALLAVFFVPFSLFLKGIKQSAKPLPQLLGILGITHITATMGYCLTQSFLSHNSGTMFYFVGVTLLLSLQRIATQEE